MRGQTLSQAFLLTFFQILTNQKGKTHPYNSIISKKLFLSGFYSLLYSFFLLEPLVKVREKEMRGKLFLCVINLEMNWHVVRRKEEVAYVTERVSFMLCQQIDPSYLAVNIRATFLTISSMQYANIIFTKSTVAGSCYL